MSKHSLILAEELRNEHCRNFENMDDRELCEMVYVHFDSHPVLPGEKTLKDSVRQALIFDGPIELTTDEKESIASQYAQTRIRETKLKEGLYYLQDATSLDMYSGAKIVPKGKGTVVNVHYVDTELQKTESGEVGVIAKQESGGYRFIGTLPDNFMANNPMLVDRCEGKLEIADYSNGKMKNISATLVVDTDLMSGDVIDLNDDMLNGLDTENGLEQ